MPEAASVRAQDSAASCQRGAGLCAWTKAGPGAAAGSDRLIVRPSSLDAAYPTGQPLDALEPGLRVRVGIHVDARLVGDADIGLAGDVRDGRPAERQPGRTGQLLLHRIERDAAAVALQLQRSLDYYESHYDQPPIAEVAVLPAGPRAAALAAGLATETGLRVHVYELPERLDCAAEVPAELQSDALYAVGAALRDERRTP